MLKKVDWSENRDYKTGSDNEPLQFYIDSLCNSQSFDLLLGYFSSAAIHVLSVGFANFIYSGGNMRMVINNVLSEQDKQAIENGQSGNVADISLHLKNIKSLKYTLDEYGKHFFNCFAWLIDKKRIQIKIIKPKNGKGISHYKSGIFSDGENKVGFKASCNFTAYGLLENLEELDCFMSWENGRSNKWINSQTNYFDEIFEERADFVEYLKVDDILVAIKNEFGDKNIQELLIQENELLEKKLNSNFNPKIKKSIKKATEKLEKYEEAERSPRFPFTEGAREYQKLAYELWKKKDSKGIFAMATGTGKTITSLNCLLEEYNKNPDKIYQALILVPTLTLVNQWDDESKRFNFNNVIKVSSKNLWENELSTLLSAAKRIPTSFIIVSTYASFTRERFNKYLKLLPKETLFIADEAHNIGASSILEKLSLIPSEMRIGLSATPKRVYDEEGSSAMEKYFEDSEPYTYNFSMERAIEEGILCRYDYHPHIVKLNTEELERYIEITKRIAKCIMGNTDENEKKGKLEKLLHQRKQIIHKAENKLTKTITILKERFRIEKNLKYTFIYVPEGNIFEINEDGSEGVDNIKIINQYTREIGRIDKSIYVNQFISGMKDRDEVLEQFKAGKIHVIASMKCLDEGVDIPRAEHAIFCSSTGNPRQFIQRRGRILRKHDDKHYAVIHDLVVIPDISKSSLDSDTFNTERNLVKKELERVMYFASLSRNPDETENVFEEICSHYKLNIYTIHNELKNS
jgi:superfamily II DNA or RNA helicase